MKSSYKQWYNTEVIVGAIIQSNGFFDDDTQTFQEDGRCMADVQPYNGALAEKEYGLVGEVSLRIYTEPTGGLLRQGRVAVANGTKYDITYVEPWEKGDIALLRLRLNQN